MSICQTAPGLDENTLVSRIFAGDGLAMEELFDANRHRLDRVIRFRLSSKLRDRVRIDHVLHVARLRTVAQFHRFTVDAAPSRFVWLRSIVIRTLHRLHRRYLAVRPAGETGFEDADRDSTFAALSFRLTREHENAEVACCRIRIERALAAMKNEDREILALRHFEELTNRETAIVTGITQQGVSTSYIRALKAMTRTMRTRRP